MSVALVDSGMAVDLGQMKNIMVALYSDSQRVLVGKCSYEHDGEGLRVLSPAENQRYEGVCRLVLTGEIDGRRMTYDARAFEVVKWTEDVVPADAQEDDVIGVRLVLEEISASLVQEIVASAIRAAEAAEEAAERANNIADMHKGEKGDTGVGIASVEQVIRSEEDGGENVVAITMTDGSVSGFVVNNGQRGSQGEVGPQGEKGDKGDQGLEGKQGPKGDSGYSGLINELLVYNGLDSEDATAALAALQGKILNEKVAQLSQELQTIIDKGLTFVVKPHIDKVVMTETTATLEPDKFYLFGEVSALNITLAPVEEGYASQYIFQFTSPLESPTTLTMPVTIIWSDIPTIKGGMTYQVSVVEGLAMITGWTTAIEE